MLMTKSIALISIVVFFLTISIGPVAESGETPLSHKDIEEILQQEYFHPHRDPKTGEYDGFVILSPGSFFEKFGFRSNDIVRVINGKKITSNNLYVFFMNSSNEAIVERNGKMETVRYNFNEYKTTDPYGRPATGGEKAGAGK